MFVCATEIVRALFCFLSCSRNQSASGVRLMICHTFHQDYVWHDINLHNLFTFFYSSNLFTIYTNY